MTDSVLPAYRALTPGVDTWASRDINQYLATHAMHVTYDSFGRMETITEQASSKVTTLQYDGARRQPNVVIESVLTTHSLITSSVFITYNADGTIHSTINNGFYAVPAWHAPVSGDRPLANDSNQFLFTHPGNIYTYDPAHQLTAVSEDSGGHRNVSFYFPGTSPVFDTVIEETNETAGTFTQTSTVLYANEKPTAVTQSVVNVPRWVAAYNNFTNISAAIQQMLALHVCNINYTFLGALAQVVENGGYRIVNFYYSFNSEYQPVSMDETTVTQEASVNLVITHDLGYLAIYGQLSQVT